MKTISRIFAAGTLAALTSLTPAIAGATVAERSDGPGVPALAGLGGADGMALQAMSDDELSGVRGGAVFGGTFNLGAFNFAFIPQINICVLCFGVEQSNFAFVLGLNNLP